MRAFTGTVILKFDDPTDGNAGVNKSITVRDSQFDTLVNIFSDDSGTALTNPFNTDSNGKFTFYAEQGTYDVIIQEGQADQAVIPSEQLADIDNGEIELSKVTIDGVDSAHYYELVNNSSTRQYRWICKSGSEPGGNMRLTARYNAAGSLIGGGELFLTGQTDWNSGVTSGAEARLKAYGTSSNGGSITCYGDNAGDNANEVHLSHGGGNAIELRVRSGDVRFSGAWSVENVFTPSLLGGCRMWPSSNREVLQISGDSSFGGGIGGAQLWLYGSNDSSTPSKTNIQGFGVTQFTIDANESQKVRRNGVDEMIVAQGGQTLAIKNLSGDVSQFRTAASGVQFAGVFGGTDGSNGAYVLAYGGASDSNANHVRIKFGGAPADDIVIDAHESQKVRRGGSDKLIATTTLVELVNNIVNLKLAEIATAVDTINGNTAVTDALATITANNPIDVNTD